MTTDTQETTALARTFLDDMPDIPDDLPSIQLDPPRLQWQHGAEVGKVKAPGVFFAKEAAFGDPPSAPWENDDRFAEKDGPGYSAEVLRIVFVGWREQWFIPGADDEPATWLRKGEMAPNGSKVKKNIEYLILIDGLPDVMVLSVSGHYKSRPFEAIMRGYEQGVLSRLIREKKKKFPRWSHWLTIGGKVDAKGQPIIESAKDTNGKEFGSNVTPPVLRAAPALVDAETFARAVDAWGLYTSLGWFKQQHLPPGTVEASYTVTSGHPQLPPGRNVPVAIDEEDLPF